MAIYLKDIPLPKALEKFEAALLEAGLFGVIGAEQIPLSDKLVGRILAKPVYANISSPHYHAAAMDGYAVRAVDTENASLTSPDILEVCECKSSTIERDLICCYVDTGDPLPHWADAVIPIENVEPLDNSLNIEISLRLPSKIRIREPVFPWRNVRVMGEDIVATELVMPAGRRLSPVDLGAIAASGHSEISVARKPVVVIIPTGSELVTIGTDVKPGEIIEFNSMVLSAQVQSWGGTACPYPIVPDEFKLIQDAVKKAAAFADLILLIAGSSAGSEDYSAEVVKSQGDLLVHGVAVRPGHPVILGMIEISDIEKPEGSGTNPTPIIGVPGYPVSAALTGEIFVKPTLHRWLGMAQEKQQVIRAQLTKKITSPAGDDDYLRVAVGKVGKQILAAPLSRGAGVITSLSRADGIVIVPRGAQGLQAGEMVDVNMYRSEGDLARTIFSIGSHDVGLDLMAQYLAYHARRFVSANVGSLGGIFAIKRRETHIAGSHLLDPNTGDYNIAYIKQYIPDIPVRLFVFVEREQGLIVAKGNPLGIWSLCDLRTPDVKFVNRQRGAGTRVLLDYELEKFGIHPKEINGYLQEEYTHLAVSAAVASGRANCGMGIAAAARALNLDFVPLFKERYDLIIPKEYLGDDLLEPVFDVLDNKEFRSEIAAFPGYDISKMGEIVAELP